MDKPTTRSEQRRLREKAELRQKLLRAAQELAAAEGWEAVTVRRVADRVEYSAPVLYSLFDNKEALVREVGREGYRTLLNRVSPLASLPERPDQRVRLVVRLMWNFLSGSPEWADAMRLMENGQPHPEEAELESLLVGLFTECFPNSDRASNVDRSTCVLAVLDGFLRRWREGRLRDRADAERLLTATVDGLFFRP